MTRASKILVVEDEWLIADDIVQVIEEAGYEAVGPVPSLQAAFALIDAESIDGALLDVRLSDQESYPIAERLASLDIPFGFLTGYNEGEIRPEFRKFICLIKPVSKKAVQAAIGQILRNERSAPASSA